LQTVTQTATKLMEMQIEMLRRVMATRGSRRVKMLRTVQTAAKRRRAASRTSMRRTGL
jgi:hypothetical protein